MSAILGQERHFIAELWDGLKKDPYYGKEKTVEKVCTELWDKLFRPSMEGIRRKAWWLGCPHGYLIEILLELAGLKTYWPGAIVPTDWFQNDGDKTAYLDKEVQRDEVKRLFRKHRLPLPMFWFANEPDTTERYIDLSASCNGAKFDDTWNNTIRLGEIDDELAVWKDLSEGTIQEKIEKAQLLKKLTADRKNIQDCLEGKKPISEAPKKDDLHKLIEKTLLGLLEQLHKEPSTMQIFDALWDYNDTEIIQEIKNSTIYWISSTAKERKTSYKSFQNRVSKIKKALST